MKATNKQDRFETCFKDPEMCFGSGSNIENCTIRKINKYYITQGEPIHTYWLHKNFH